MRLQGKQNSDQICYTFLYKKTQAKPCSYLRARWTQVSTTAAHGHPQGLTHLSTAPCSQHPVRLAVYLHRVKWLYTLYYCLQFINIFIIFY